MARFRARRDDDDAPAASAAPAIRPVSRSAPPRPRWGALYGAVIIVSAVEFAGHLWFQQSLLRHVCDAGCAAGAVGILWGWVSLNRVALTRLDEPDAGIGKPEIRIVRSRARTRRDERVHLPFDFR